MVDRYIPLSFPPAQAGSFAYSWIPGDETGWVGKDGAEIVGYTPSWKEKDYDL
jgi:hypothetical protein